MSAEIFSNIYNGPFKRYLLLSKNIGQDVQNQSEIADLAFQAELRYLEYSENFKKPPSANIVLNPIIHQIDKTKHYVCSDPSLGDHINVVSQSIGALMWVQEKDPVCYLEEILSDAKTYTDILLVFFKDKELHVEWVEAWLETLNDLNNFVRRRYPKGLTWKGELEIPNSELLQDLTEFQTLNTDNLYNEINKGQTIQEALRRLNSQNVVQEEEKQQEIAPPPAVFHRDGKKWKIEHQRGAEKHLTINEAEPDNVLYIYDCKNITLVVERKVNVIKLDNCEKISLIFRSLISGVEIIASRDLKLHAFGTVPSISIDSCSDVNIHLTKKGLDAQVVTSQCSKISLSYPMEDGYYKTFYIPSRLMTTISPDHSLRTSPVIDE
ncbi:adenylyl cyclase-associated protein 1-like [Coccinella septempunctata]|uniref:adenylyl cyclase-associated protein 1-like n=1 Tax=Coccinella septempunctata TaxID=41139 RepID=UPI001D05EEC3|nr:adenylyl cyclase-associated protein 1-like [Coccinella septempunctata]